MPTARQALKTVVKGDGREASTPAGHSRGSMGYTREKQSSIREGSIQSAVLDRLCNMLTDNCFQPCQVGNGAADF